MAINYITPKIQNNFSFMFNIFCLKFEINYIEIIILCCKQSKWQNNIFFLAKKQKMNQQKETNHRKRNTKLQRQRILQVRMLSNTVRTELP